MSGRLCWGEVRLVRLGDLRPNNWYVNAAKLERVREAWRGGTQERLPPVLVTEIDAEMALIDGHARSVAAFERGATHIRALAVGLKEIAGDERLYRHIHHEGVRLGVMGIADLLDRIVGPDEHACLWVGYCDRWLEENS